MFAAETASALVSQFLARRREFLPVRYRRAEDARESDSGYIADGDRLDIERR